MIIRINMILLLLIMFFGALFETGFSESKMNNEIKLNTSFEDFEWLAGHWEGEAFGGTFEEVWSPASAGSMCGTFKLSSGDKVSFYEIFIITIDSTGLPVLKLKHFNADLTGWEEKDEVMTFPFVSCKKDELIFDGLGYYRTSEKTMQIILRTKDSDGKITDNIIDCKRMND